MHKNLLYGICEYLCQLCIGSPSSMLHGNNCCYLYDTVCFYISETFFFLCRHKNDHLAEPAAMWSTRKKDAATAQPSQGRGPSPPTKEDILSTLENFGDSTDPEKENNNNKQPSRQQSEDSLDDWEKPDPPSASTFNSYR